MLWEHTHTHTCGWVCVCMCVNRNCGGSAALLVYTQQTPSRPVISDGSHIGNTTNSLADNDADADKSAATTSIRPKAEPQQGAGPISKAVAKIKDTVEAMFDHTQDSVALAKKTAQSFLDNLPLHRSDLAQEVHAALAAEGKGEGIDMAASGPIPKIVERIIIRKIKGLTNTMFDRVLADVAAGKRTALSFVEHLPGDDD